MTGSRDRTSVHAPRGELRGVLLDIDGTLLDSNHAHARAWVDALEGEGISWPIDRVRPLIGMGGDKLIPYLAKVAKDSPLGKALDAKRRQLFLTFYLPELGPTPGARELIQQLRSDGLTCSIATSASKDEVWALLEAAAVADLIEDTPEDAGGARSKPDVDVVQAAIDRSGFTASQLVMIGDTKYDVEAARAAAVPFIGLRCGRNPEGDLAGALAVYDDPADLLARYASSPFARTAASRVG